MEFEKQTPDEIVENAENAQGGEIADDEAEAVAGGGYFGARTEQWTVPQYHTGVHADTHTR